MKLTKNFSLAEFDCNDGTPVPKELIPNVQKLANQLQALRDALGVPLRVNSGYRTPAYNKSVGGKANSQHIPAKAADIASDTLTPKQIAAKIEELIASGDMLQGGIGVYKKFVHYDIRGKKARW